MNELREDVIKDLLMMGDKAAAIRKYKEFTGLDLDQSRNCVNVMEEQLRVKQYRMQPPLPDTILTKLIEKFGSIDKWNYTNKIGLIKECRELAQRPLKEAKDTIEDYMDKRKDWPNVSWFLYKEVKHLIAVEVRGTTVILKAASRVMNDMKVTIEEAKNIVFAIIEDRIPEPEEPPKFRSIDEGWS